MIPQLSAWETIYNGKQAEGQAGDRPAVDTRDQTVLQWQVTLP